MTKENTNRYLTYNPDLDQFVRIKKLGKKGFGPFFEEIRELTDNIDFTIGAYRGFVVDYFVEDVDHILEGLREEYNETELAAVVPEIIVGLYEGVTQVYPFLGITSIADALNNITDQEGTLEVTTSQAAKTFSDLPAISKLNKQLKDRVIGQDAAVDELTKILKLKAAGLCDFTTHFFIGPTGVGKTELSKALAEEVYGSEKKLLKINCGEYSSSHEYAKLLGSPPGYIGHQEKALLQEKAEESNEWVILFDEIEKAHHKLHNVLLNLLDEGTVMDSHGNVLDFSKSVILMTSNVGVRQFVGKTSVGFGAKENMSYEDAREDIDQEFKAKFSPEFINRIQSTVYFNELSKDDAKKITKNLLKKYPVAYQPKLINYIVDQGFSRQYGARNIKRFIQSEVAVSLADAILTHGKDITFKAEFNKDGSLSCFSPKKPKEKRKKPAQAGL